MMKIPKPIRFARKIGMLETDGFSVEELKRTGISVEDARSLGIPIDERRRFYIIQNVEALKTYVASIRGVKK